MVLCSASRAQPFAEPGTIFRPGALECRLVTSFGLVPLIVVLATAGPRLVAVPSAPSNGCPNAAQVADALRARLPDAAVPARMELWPSARDILRSVLEVAPDGTLVRFSLVDSRGEVQLRRSLPTAVRGDADECIALAEALAAIVERFLDFPDYESRPDPSLAAPWPGLAGVGPTSLVGGTTANTRDPRHGGLSLYLGGSLQTGDQTDYAAHVGAELEVGRLRVPIALTASLGWALERVAVLATTRSALRRIPLRVGAATELSAGPGAFEPTVALGIDVIHVTGTTPQPSDSMVLVTEDWQTRPILEGAVGYRIAFGPRLFVRALGGAGVAFVRYEVTRMGSAAVLQSTPRSYLTAGLETGMVFR
jgi:hypothetical protein